MVDDAIVAWYGRNGAEWRRKDNRSPAKMTKPEDYVRHSDYAALEAEAERLRELVSASEKERYRSCGELVARAVASDARAWTAEACIKELVAALEPFADMDAPGTLTLSAKAMLNWLERTHEVSPISTAAAPSQGEKP